MSQNKFLHKYSVESTRLKNYDYSRSSVFFVTICTRSKIDYFGKIIENVVHLTQLGNIAKESWLRIPEFHPYVLLDQFVIMPNHVHGIIIIDKMDETNNLEIRNDIDVNSKQSQFEYKNKFGPQSRNLASIIRGYKASVKSFAQKHAIDFEWQRNYYDRIVRNHKEFEKIQGYIIDNPTKWLWEKEQFVENMKM